MSFIENARSTALKLKSVWEKVLDTIEHRLTEVRQHVTPGMKSALKHIFIGLLIILIAKIGWQLIQLLWVLRHPVLTANDATVYLSLGHAMMNGLRIYTDVFEIKPPGIFLMSYASLILTKGPLLALVIQMTSYILVPVLLLSISRRTILDSLLAIIFGVSIAIFLADRTHGLQPECYGSFFALLFLICIYKGKNILASIPLLGALWMKEPFALSILAGVLILASDLRYVLRNFFVPLCIAGGAGLLLLVVTGTFHEYVFTYLAEIFSGRLQYAREFGFADMPSYFISQPLWTRGLMHRMLSGEWPWFHAIIPLLLCGTFFLRKGAKTWAPIGIIAVCIGLYLFRKIEVMYDLLAIIHFRVPFHDAFFQTLIVQYVFILVAFLLPLVLLYIKDRRVLRQSIFILIAIYCATLSVCIGGTFNWHHFAFASPAYISLFLLYQKSEERWKILLIPLFVLMAFVSPKVTIEKRLSVYPTEMAETQKNIEYASAVDRIMDECHYERYMSWTKRLNVGAFTRHSPFEFYYAQLAGFDGYSVGPMSKWKEQYLASLQKAPLFVTDDASSIPQEIEQILDEKFTTEPPPCVQSKTGTTVFYRKEK